MRKKTRTVQVTGPWPFFAERAREFCERWDPAFKISEGDLMVLAAFALGPESTRQAWARCFATIFHRAPDFTLAWCAFARKEWNSKFMGPQVEKFLLSERFWSEARVRFKKPASQLHDWQVARLFERDTGTRVSLDLVKKTRELLASRLQKSKGTKPAK